MMMHHHTMHHHTKFGYNKLNSSEDTVWKIIQVSTNCCTFTLTLTLNTAKQSFCKDCVCAATTDQSLVAKGSEVQKIYFVYMSLICDLDPTNCNPCCVYNGTSSRPLFHHLC